MPTVAQARPDAHPPHAVAPELAAPDTTRARSSAGYTYRAVHVAALDRACFVAPYVLIGADNTSPARVATLATARAALARADVATIAARLRPGVLAADIDPDPEHAVHGDAIAEQLLAWCQHHQVPYLLRESGRPGGRHVLAVTASPALTAAWARLCAALARRWHVVVDDRTGRVLRLLGAAHRHGRPAPVLGGTLTPAHLLDLPRDLPRRHRGAPTYPSAATGHDGAEQLDVDAHDVELATGTATMPAAATTTAAGATSPRSSGDASRSAVEYGRACAHARADHTAEQAWADIDHPGTHARARGRGWWLAYVWMPAVTTVAAEHGVAEDEAWQRARAACPHHCAQRGRSWWRGLWRRALDEAARDRPRRRHLTDHPDPRTTEPAAATSAPATDPAVVDPGATGADAQQLAALRRALHAVVEDLLPALGTRPQRVHSVQALLYALAAVLLSDRAGSVSHRDLAERARLDTKTVRAALAVALAAGLIVLSRRYVGGATDSDAYALGPALAPHLTGAITAVHTVADRPVDQTSPTSCSTPPTPHGAAQVALLRTRHAADRRHWRLRCALVDALAGTADTFAGSTHPAAKTLRSLYFQRSWWGSLTPAQQDERRAERRAVLGRLPAADRSTWLAWLTRREHLRLIVERFGHDVATTADRDTLAHAPVTVHRGMCDPRWRTAGTPAVPTVEQLVLVA